MIRMMALAQLHPSASFKNDNGRKPLKTSERKTGVCLEKGHSLDSRKNNPYRFSVLLFLVIASSPYFIRIFNTATRPGDACQELYVRHPSPVRENGARVDAGRFQALRSVWLGLSDLGFRVFGSTPARLQDRSTAFPSCLCLRVARRVMGSCSRSNLIRRRKVWKV